MSRQIQREESASFDRQAITYIREAAEHGLYEIRGMGAKRKVPSFDDLVLLTASASRYPLEGYRERCVTKTVLGNRVAVYDATDPLSLIPLRWLGPGDVYDVGARRIFLEERGRDPATR